MGTKLRLGESVLLELSQVGKVCHVKCAIWYLAGDCIFPREGIFFVVLEGGELHVGDGISIEELGDGTCEFTPQEALDEIEERNRAEEEADGCASAQIAGKMHQLAEELEL